MKKNIESIVKKFIDLCNEKFPSMFSAYYVCGSQMDNSANKNSDIDLILITEVKAENQLITDFKNFLSSFNQEYKTLMGPAIFELEDLTTMPAFLKQSVFIQGQDHFKNIPLQPIEYTIKRFIQGGFKFISIFLRLADTALTYPIEFVDKKSEFLGYTLSEEDYGTSTKRISNAIARFCGALISLQWGERPTTKRNSIETYTNLSSCSFKNWVRDTFDLLVNQWEYELPSSQEDLNKLNEILVQFNKFENYFLERVTPFILEQISKDEDKTWLATCQNYIDLKSLPHNLLNN